jgi:hypothetical protein
MRITRLEVEGIGRFATRTVVEGFGEGVNVLMAGNEAGKSTLFRAIRACFFKRHSALDSDVKALIADNTRLPPSVTVGFEHENAQYEITKTFSSSRSAQLRKNGVEIARNATADEELWNILGLSPGSGRSIDEATFGLLWVGQRHSFETPAFTDGATSALTAAIASEVGALVGGERARMVLAELEIERDRYLTSKGRPKTEGPLDLANRALAELDEKLTGQKSRQKLLDGQFTELQKKREERLTLADPVKIAADQTELKTADTNFKAAEAASALLAQREAELISVEAESRLAISRLNDLLASHQRIDTARGRKAGFEAKLAELTKAEATVQATLAELAQAQETLQGQSENDEKRDNVLRTLQTAIDRQTRQTDANGRLKELERLSGELTNIDGELKALAVDDKAIAQIDGIERDLAKIEVRLQAGAPRFVVAVRDMAADQIYVDGAPLTGDYVGFATKATAIAIGAHATVTVSPPEGYGEKDRGEAADIGAKLAALLRKTGATSVEDARSRYARRQILLNGRARVAAGLSALNVEAGALSDEIERVRAGIAEAEGVIATALTAAGLAKLPGSDEIEDEHRRLKEALQAAQAKRAGFETTLKLKHAELIGVSTQRSQTAGQLGELQRSLKSDLQIHPDEDRSAERSACEALVIGANLKLEGARARLEKQKQAADPNELERWKLRLERLRSAEKNRATTLGALDVEIARLEAVIQAAGGEGLGEQLAATEELYSLAARQQARVAQSVKVTELLLDKIKACLDESRDRYYEPVRRHLQPFLNDLFPGAQIEIGDGFQIEGIRRGGTEAESFTRLSDGTQEQIAVLVRLALGSMLAERGHSVPIILDDALVYSDDDRIQRMFDSLSRAGKFQQVIVLTCRSRVFETLGGRLLHISSNVEAVT